VLRQHELRFAVGDRPEQLLLTPEFTVQAEALVRGIHAIAVSPGMRPRDTEGDRRDREIRRLELRN